MFSSCKILQTNLSLTSCATLQMKELKHLNKYFRKYWFKLLVGILITITARIFSLVMPSYVNKSVKLIEDFVAAKIVETELRELALQYILIILGSALLSGLFTFLMRQTIINVSRFIEYDLKNEIFDHYQLLNLDFYKKNRTGDLMNRISEDVNQVRMYAGPAIMYGINALTLFACLIPLMFIKAPTLALYTILPFPLLSILIYKISKIIHQSARIFIGAIYLYPRVFFGGSGN